MSMSSSLVFEYSEPSHDPAGAVHPIRWKKQFGDLGTAEVRELRQLREENRKLKQLVADLSLDKTILREALGKKF